MLTFDNIYEKLERYEKDNYYLNRQADFSVKTISVVGSGWDKLGIDKNSYEITEKDYQSLRDGKGLDGEFLSQNFEKEHRQGYDMTWTPHKSVTLFAYKDKETLEKMTNIMNEISQKAIEFSEKQGFIQYRETLNGETVSKASDNATALVNVHLTGRADPNLHSHLVFFNFTQTEKGDWKALNSDALHKNKYVIEAYMENQLAYEIRQQFGIQTEMVKEGESREYVTKISGIEKEHWEGIATMSKAIDEYLAQHREELLQKYPNASESQLREYAYLAIRPSKESKTLSELFNQVEKALSEKGLTREDIAKLVSQYERQDNLSVNDIVNKAIDELQERHSSWTKSDVLKASFQISGGRFSSDEVVKAVEQNERLVYLGNEQIQTRKATIDAQIYTSKDVIAWEKTIVENVERGKGIMEQIKNVDFTSDKLTKSQTDAINFILHSRDKITAVEGWAGTGKTTFLTELQQFIKDDGYRILGLSSTNTAVNELKDRGIDAMTTTKFLHTSKDKLNIDNKTIVVIDEASFLSTKELKDIINRIGDGRLVLIGDTRQLTGVQAGTPYGLLVRENLITHTMITDIIRQKNETLKQAVYDIYRKDIEAALSKIDVKTIEGANEVAFWHVLKEKDIASKETVEKTMQAMNIGSIVAVVEREPWANSEKTEVKAVTLPFEREIAENLGANFKVNRQGFFMYKDLLGIEGKEKELTSEQLEKEKEYRTGLQQMINNGWVVLNKATISGKTYYFYQKTSLFV